MIKQFALKSIRAYQVYLRYLFQLYAMLPFGNCRFSPTCSLYCGHAIQKHGLFFGVLLGVWRIVRCNPFSKGGHDPVPSSILLFKKGLLQSNQG